MRRQRNMDRMKEQNNTPIKELSEMEIANPSDAEFKTLVIKMLRNLTEYGKSIRKEMKATLSEINKNLQGMNSEGRKLGFKSTIRNIRKKKAFKQNSKKKKEF